MRKKKHSILLVDQHTEIGGGQRVTLSLVDHSRFREEMIAVNCVPGEGSYTRELKLVGTQVILFRGVNVANGKKTYKDYLCYLVRMPVLCFWIWRAIADHGIGACYTSSPRYLGPVWLACWISRVPLFAHIHCFYRDRLQERVLGVFLRRRTVAAVLCPSRAVWRWAWQSLGVRKNLKYIPNWLLNCESVDVGTVQSKNLPRVSQNSFRVGLVGRIVELKGHDVFLSAIAGLITGGRDVEAYVVGGAVFAAGDNYAENLQRKFGKEPRIHFLGQVWPIDWIYGKLDCVVIASRSEAFGLTAIEAMSQRVPVVVTNVDELPFIVGNGSSGVVVEFGDTKGLMQAIISLMDDRQLREKIVANGYCRVEQLFNRDKSVARFLKILNSRIEAAPGLVT